MNTNVYLVQGFHKKLGFGEDVKDCVDTFGIFSTEDRAKEIKMGILNNFKEYDEEIEVVITLIKIDEPLDIYNFYMEC